MRRLLILGCLVISGLAGLLPSWGIAQAQSGYSTEVEWDACPFWPPSGEVEGETIDCGYLVVPQDRSNPGGTQIELAFAVLYATGDNPAPDPVVYLEGGPGGSALAGVASWVESPFREARDIVLLDQRGTGYSSPRLYCSEVDELLSDDADAYNEALAECRQRLIDEEGVDVSQYNSAESAADVADLRVALGYDEWNVMGISYGTRLALTVVRDHPEGIRSVVIDSVYPPVVDAYEEGGAAVYRAFHQMFTDCAADPECSSAYPDLENRFYAMIDRLNETPIYVESEDSDYSGDDIINTVFEIMYDTASIPYLPQALDDLDQGDATLLFDIYYGAIPNAEYGEEDPVISFVYAFYDELYAYDDDTYAETVDAVYAWEGSDRAELETLVSETFDTETAEYLLDLLGDVSDADLERLAYELQAEDVSDTEGMFDTVECNEEIPFNNVDEEEALTADLPQSIQDNGYYTLVDEMDSCAVWNAGTADPREDLAVVSSIPTLVLAGQYDPVTPPDWGRIAASTLANSFFYEFPGVGHDAMDSAPCAMAITVAFLAAPTTEPDSGCVTTMGPPDFQ